MTAYFVDKTGSDSNAGTVGVPWLTINHAATSTSVLAGDSVEVNDGTYTESIRQTRGGTAGNLVTFKSKNRRGAKVIGVGNASTWVHLANYCSYDGFDISNTGTGHGFDGTDGSFVGPHHLTWTNNYIHGCGASGIGVGWGDYYTMTGNEVTGCCGRNVFHTSGLNIYQAQKFDSVAGFHNIINRNKVYSNTETTAITPGTHTDGNGIIIDDLLNSQSSGHQTVSYDQATLVENNLVYNNGGGGIQCYLSDHVTIRNNTSYLNRTDLDSNFNNDWLIEINIQDSNNCSSYNNIAICDNNAPKPTGSTKYSYGEFRFIGGTSSGTVIDHCLARDLAGTATSVKQQNSGTTPTNMLNDTDPVFVTPGINHATNDFHLQAGSPAIAAGTTSSSTHAADDIDQNVRSSTLACDIGAYAVVGATSGIQSLVFSPNSVIGTVGSTGTITLNAVAPPDRTNLILQSNAFSTTWTLNGADVALASAAGTSPSPLDGTNDAWKLKDATTNNVQHYVGQSIVKAASALPYAFTIYAKAVEHTRVLVFMSDNSGNYATVYFDLAGGQVAIAPATNGTFSAASAQITNEGNGWYRCSTIATSSTATALNANVYLDSGSGTGAASNTYAGTIGSGVLIYGADLKQSSLVSAYIPTTTVAVTVAGGALVTLSSGNVAVSVPASVTVTAGGTTATFAATTTSVLSSTAVTVTGNYNGLQTGVLTVTPTIGAPTLLSISVSA